MCPSVASAARAVRVGARAAFAGAAGRKFQKARAAALSSKRRAGTQPARPVAGARTAGTGIVPDRANGAGQLLDRAARHGSITRCRRNGRCVWLGALAAPATG